MTPTCEKCKGHGERTDGGEWLCPRCGVWLNVAGDVIGPPITEEQAKANYEAFVVDTAGKMINEANALKADPENYVTLTLRKRSTSGDGEERRRLK